MLGCTKSNYCLKIVLKLSFTAATTLDFPSLNKIQLTAKRKCISIWAKKKIPLKHFMGIYKTYRNQPSHVASPVAKKVKRKRRQNKARKTGTTIYTMEKGLGFKTFQKCQQAGHNSTRSRIYFKKLPAYDLIYVFYITLVSLEFKRTFLEFILCKIAMLSVLATLVTTLCYLQ